MTWPNALFVAELFGAVVGLVIAAIRYFGSNKSSAAAPPRKIRTGRLLLDERYARGQIEREEYPRKRRDLTRLKADARESTDNRIY